MIKIETQIDGLGSIYYSDDSAFNTASKQVLSKSKELISLRDLAYARIKSGKKSSLSQNGSYVREGILFLPFAENRRLLLRKSLVLQHSFSAVNAHEKNREYFLPKNFNVESYLEQIGKDNYQIVTYTQIPTNRFGEDKITVWAFQDQAEEYGRFLRSTWMISAWYINTHTDNKYIDMQSKPFANQLYFHDIQSGSNIFSSEKGLHNKFRVTGLSCERYTPTEIRQIFQNTLHNIGITGNIKKAIFSDLEHKLK